MPVAPDRRLIFLLNAGHRRVQRWLEVKMAANGGLTAAQSGVLFFLGEKDGALIGEAADALDLAPSAMPGLLDRMTKRAAREEAKAGLQGIKAQLAEGFTDDEIDVVARWLASLQTKFPKGDT